MEVMIERLPSPKHPANVAAVVVVLLMAAHIALVMRLMDEELILKPDAAEYVIGARALVTGHGFRDLSDPAMPRLSRPIGTSMILAPVLAWRGYDVIACKIVILAIGLGSCVVTLLLARQVISALGGLLVVGLLALSPVTVLYNGQVLSEVPYTFYSMAILLLVAGSGNPDRSISWGRLAVLAGLCVAAEKTRTLGLVLWAALGFWAIGRPDRQRIVAVLLLAFVASMALELYAGTNNSTLQSYWRYVSDQGVGGLGEGLRGSARLYLSALAGLVIPTLWPDLSWCGLGHFHVVPPLVTCLVGGAVVGIAAWGIVGRARQTGWQGESRFVVTYLAGALAVLLLWPHRTIRLIYPIVPICAVYFWLEVSRWTRWKLRTVVPIAGLLVHLLAAGWFLWSARPLSRGAAWSEEGTWLRENTPPFTRITTDEKSLFVYSRRFQRTLSLQGIGLEELNQALLSSGGGYLAVSGWNDKPMLWANPAFVFRRVTVVSSVARQIKLWEVQPNFLGTVPEQPPLAADAISYDEPENVLASHELVLREAQHLHSLGRLPEAERLLRQLLGPTPPHAPDATPVWVELGNLLLHAGRPQEAIDCYRRGMGGQTSDVYRLNIVSGLAAAERFARAADESVPASQRATVLAEIATAHARMARWVPALETVERAIQLDRDFVNGRLLHVLMLRRLGKTTLALQAIDTVLDVLRAQFPDARLRAAQPVHRNAIEQLFLIRVPEILEGEPPVDVALDEETISVDPGDPTAYTRIVELLLRDGLPGVALRTLQTGTARHPNDGRLWLTLGNVWMAFGRFKEAKDCFSRAEQLGLRRQAAPGLARLTEFLEARPIQ